MQYGMNLRNTTPMLNTISANLQGEGLTKRQGVELGIQLR